MPTTQTTVSRTPRSARLGIRATQEQETVLRRAADVSRKSLTEFILESACLAAEQTLLDQRLFMTSDSRCRTLLELLERPPKDNAGLKELFSKPAPWEV